MSLKEKKLNWVRLARTGGVGPIMFWDLIRLFGEPGFALDNLKIMLKKTKKELMIPEVGDVTRELESVQKIGAKIIIEPDDAYPNILRNLRDRPPILTTIGSVELLSRRCVAIVGSRNASFHGMTLAHNFAEKIAAEGFVIVSGLAKGIDLAAHKSSLDFGTVAVVAGGIDYIYPKENAQWYKKIGSEGGCIISELPVGCPPLTKHFPQRNRIIAGLSLVVVIIEAAQKSGTLITARQALDYGREVVAVPGSPMDPRSYGANELIKQGALLVTSAQDVIDVANNVKTQTDFKLFDNTTDETVAFTNNTTSIISRCTDRELSGYKKLILSYLSHTPINIGELVEHLEIPMPIVTFILIELELNEDVYRTPDNKFAIMPKI